MLVRHTVHKDKVCPIHLHALNREFRKQSNATELV